MATSALWVPLVVIPASAASLLVLALDRRAHRRRPCRLPVPSRLTAALGAALGAGGFALASIAGIASGAHAAHGPEQVWITTATANGSLSVVPVDPLAIASLPYAPLEIWGTGFDNDGGWQIAAAVPGGPDVVLASGSWPAVSGEGVRVLTPSVDPAALVAAAKAAGVSPQNGAYTFVLSSSDPEARVVFTLAAPPPPVLQSPASAKAASGVPPITGAYASAVRPRSTTAAPAPPPVGVPGTGGGAPLVAGLAMLLAGGASAGLSLRLSRGKAVIAQR